MLADLHPLLPQALNWFKEMVGKREVVSEVRSSELETRLSSSDDPVEAKFDTATLGPLSFGRREVRSFHAFKDECALEADTLFRFRDKFQFLNEVRIRLPKEGEKACHF